MSGTAAKTTTSPATPTARACTTSSATNATQTRAAATKPCSTAAAAAVPSRPTALPGPRSLVPLSPVKTSPSLCTTPIPSNSSPWSSSPPSGAARSGWRPAVTSTTSPRPNSSSTPTKPTGKTAASASAPSLTTQRTSPRQSSMTKTTTPRSTTWPSCPIRAYTSASPRFSTPSVRDPAAGHQLHPHQPDRNGGLARPVHLGSRGRPHALYRYRTLEWGKLRHQSAPHGRCTAGARRRRDLDLLQRPPHTEQCGNVPALQSLQGAVPARGGRAPLRRPRRALLGQAAARPLRLHRRRRNRHLWSPNPSTGAAQTSTSMPTPAGAKSTPKSKMPRPAAPSPASGCPERSRRLSPATACGPNTSGNTRTIWYLKNPCA